MKVPFMVSALAALVATLQPAAAQDAASGQKLFKQRCQGCHTVEPGGRSGVGPNLAGVFGRAAGTADYKYSPALAKSGLVWDEATLEAFLAAPTKAVRGTKIAVGLPNAGQRADIIEYLEGLPE